MAVICRLIQVAPGLATQLATGSGDLSQVVQSARVYSDVYRYRDGIQFLLAHHRPGSQAGRWLDLGTAVSQATEQVPAARIISAADVARLDREVHVIEPEDLAPHYDASALDNAGIYPRRWLEWEETFDPLGEVLEHYTFLQSAARNCAASGNALLLYFVDNGDDD
jgi:Domain of unknown function (DUF1877)